MSCHRVKLSFCICLFICVRGTDVQIYPMYCFPIIHSANKTAVSAVLPTVSLFVPISLQQQTHVPITETQQEGPQTGAAIYTSYYWLSLKF